MNNYLCYVLLNNIILNGFVIIALLNNSNWICDDSGIISPSANVVMCALYFISLSCKVMAALES
jgi:hypothetical protein